jgi:hypothetical protein
MLNVLKLSCDIVHQSLKRNKVPQIRQRTLKMDEEQRRLFTVPTRG